LYSTSTTGEDMGLSELHCGVMQVVSLAVMLFDEQSKDKVKMSEILASLPQGMIKSQAVTESGNACYLRVLVPPLL
jgi:hypothetical protein